MMRIKNFIFSAIFLSLAFSCKGKEVFNKDGMIVPRPLTHSIQQGSYTFSDKTTFVVENEEQKVLVETFVSMFSRSANFTPKVVFSGSHSGDIKFMTDNLLKNEAYELNVSSEGISIKASTNSGFFYALQTLRLMLPSEIESLKHSDANWIIPAVSIKDEPRFEYRGVLLDVSRYFIPKENVIRIIDCMSMLKLNVLHFHLTDDNGWRIEIKKYPKLTEVGAWRVDRGETPFPARRNPNKDEVATVGGFYTRRDIKEIVKYATERHVEVIPEIDMPAHSNAALAAYPDLACPTVQQFIGVLPGLGGNNADIIYCAGNEKVYSFLQDIIDEIIELFPSRYIHLGGDEAKKTHWEKCPLCQKKKKDEQLANEEDLQGYFMSRMSDYVRSKGREVIGWDELTNSSFLPKGTIIQGWQGYGQAALKAAEKGHRFIMTPARVMYLIRYQGPQWFEPLTYFGNNTLQDVYNYEPVQEKWKPEYENLLMGIQGSLWTEFCSKPEDVDYLLFPRLAAVAEVAWTKPDRKDWISFLKAMDKYNMHLEAKGVRYARSMYNIQHKATTEEGVIKVQLECIRPDLQIKYSLDGSDVEFTSKLYTAPITISDNVTLKAATFSGNKMMGEVLTIPIKWNKATAKPILGNKKNNDLMVNGVRGSIKYTDFEWCNWDRNDNVSFTIDLNKTDVINSVTIGTITNYGMGVHKPKSIKILVSDDNSNFAEVASLSFAPEQIFVEGTYIEDFTLNTNGVSGRYVKIAFEGAGKCPENHVRPVQDAKVYFDEVIIN